MRWLDSLAEVDSAVMDARGRRVQVRWNDFDREITADLRLMDVDPPDPKAWREYQRSLRQAMSIWYHILMSGLIALLASVALLAAVLALPDRPVMALFAGGSGALCLFVAWRHPRWTRRRVWMLRCSLIGSGRCFGCGYILHKIDPEDDGCLVCPECGAAWHILADVHESGQAGEGKT